MAEETNAHGTRSRKKIRRVRIGFNVLAQIVLVLFLVAMVNSMQSSRLAQTEEFRGEIKRVRDGVRVVD